MDVTIKRAIKCTKETQRNPNTWVRDMSSDLIDVANS